MSMMRIAVSIGHYPDEPGAKSKRDGYEYGLVAPVAGYLIRYLQQAGHLAYAVPSGRLGRKVDWVNNGVRGQAFDLALEIHGNADPDNDAEGQPVACGCEVLHHPGSRLGERYAQYIQAELVRRLGQRDRGTKPGDFFWLRKTHAPAVIVEPAFVDSERGSCIISEEPDKIAHAICAGVLACFSHLDGGEG